MRLAFIYPPFREIINQPSIKKVSRNYGVYPPINLAYVAGVAQNAGHEILLIDANALNLTKKQLMNRLKKFSPDAVLFTITTYLFHQTLEWIRYIKSNIDVISIVGGVHVGLYPKETLSHEEIDYAIIGDSEKTLPSLLYTIEKNKPWKNRRPECQNFIPGVYPLREQLPNERYHEFITRRRNFTGIITTRGCPYRCSYCEQGSKDYFWKREPEDVMDEIQISYDRFRIREIDFFDPIFSLDKKRTLEMCSSIKRLKLDFDYAIRTRADRVDHQILNALKKSGCTRIYYGIESTNKEILKNLNKTTDIMKIKQAIKMTKGHGIGTFGYFMMGSPGETFRTMRDSVRFAIRSGLDYAQFNKTTALAGTTMYGDLMKQMSYDFWSKYTLEKHEPDWILPRLGTKLPNNLIEKEIARAYRRFYYRPRYVFRQLSRVRSMDELKRYLRAGLDFLN